jgi:putative flippase GtrA
MIQKITRLPFIRFAGVGALSTIIDFAVYNILLRLGVEVHIAAALGFFAGFTNGYLLNSRYVFSGGSRARYIKYLLVSLGGLVLTEIIIDIAHVRGGLSENIAKLIAVILVFIWNYFLSKFWAFQDTES